MIYLNYADGRKPRLLNELVVKNPKKNFEDFDSLLRNLLHLQNKDFLSYSQNVTTSLIFSLQKILNVNPNYSVYISTHEIKWFETLFKEGKLPIHETTYPNYVKQEQVSFIKKKIRLFNPEKISEFLESTIDSKPSIIILSHVSRMTGQNFLTQSLYKKIKKINSQNILIVDGSQSAGAMNVFPKKVSDIYLGMTPKYINAEPHIGFCYVHNKIKKHFNFTDWTINPIDFFREIYSALKSIKKITIDSKKIKQKRKLLEGFLKKKNFITQKVRNQVGYITIIQWKEDLEKVIYELSKNDIIISHNQKYSIVEPKIPGIRVSFTTKTKNSELKKFVKILDQIKKSRT